MGAKYRTGGRQPLARAMRNSRVASFSTLTNEPTLGGVIPKSEKGKVSEPATWIVEPFSWARAGIATPFVVPWIVRSPSRVRSTGDPARAAGRDRDRGGQLERRRRIGRALQPDPPDPLVALAAVAGEGGQVGLELGRGHAQVGAARREGRPAGDRARPTHRVALGRQLGQLLPDPVADDGPLADRPRPGQAGGIDRGHRPRRPAGSARRRRPRRRPGSVADAVAPPPPMPEDGAVLGSASGAVSSPLRTST